MPEFDYDKIAEIIIRMVMRLGSGTIKITRDAYTITINDGFVTFTIEGH